MRDDHYRDHIATGPQQIPHTEDPEPDEIQPLLFDLVRAGKVEAVRNLICQFEALPREIKKAIRECAASFGSAAMIDLIEPFDNDSLPFGALRSSIQAGNIDLFHHLQSRAKNSAVWVNQREYLYFIREVLESDSEEAYESLVSRIESDLSPTSGPSRDMLMQLLDSSVIHGSDGNPDRENLLLALWEKVGVPKSGDRKLGTGLVNVASSTCSVKLAEYLIGHGAMVDFRLSDKYLTPLQHAARQTSAAAAEMMKYLLLQGADPELKAQRASLRIRDEKGAKRIAKWLGMSWDELVAKTKEEREKIASKSIESVG